MINISVDLDVEDFYWDLRKRDKEELVELLSDDGLCIPVKNGARTQDSVLDELWKEEITKLLNSRLTMTSEQEDIILGITKTL